MRTRQPNVKWTPRELVLLWLVVAAQDSPKTRPLRVLLGRAIRERECKPAPVTPKWHLPGANGDLQPLG